MSDAEREQLEREISVLLGYHIHICMFEDQRGGKQNKYQLVKPDGNLAKSAYGTVLETDTEEGIWKFWGPKWTRSEEASARLLEILMRGGCCITEDNDGILITAPPDKHTDVVETLADTHQGWSCEIHREVVALAARAWLQSLTPEERAKLHG